jgi:hypothetical protein
MEIERERHTFRKNFMGKDRPIELIYQAKSMLEEAAVSPESRKTCLAAFGRFFSSSSSKFTLSLPIEELPAWAEVFSLISTYFARAQTESLSAKRELTQLLTLNKSPKSPFRERVEIYAKGPSRDDDEEEDSSDVELKKSLEDIVLSKQVETDSRDSDDQQYYSPSPSSSPSPSRSHGAFSTPPLRTQLESSPKLIRREPPAEPPEGNDDANLVVKKVTAGERDLILARRQQSLASPDPQKPRKRDDTPRPLPKKCPSIEEFIIDEVIDDL